MRASRGARALLACALLAAECLLDRGPPAAPARRGLPPAAPLATGSTDAFRASQRGRFPAWWWNLSAYPAPPPAPLLFHLVWTTPSANFLPRLTAAAILRQHPGAAVRVWSNTLPDGFFGCLGGGGGGGGGGGAIALERYSLAELAAGFGEPLRAFIRNDTLAQNAYLGTHGASWRWSHESDLVRFFALARDGGVYLDTDELLLAPVPAAALAAPLSVANGPDDPAPAEAAALLGEVWTRGPGVACGFVAVNARFPQGTAFVRAALDAAPRSYNKVEWPSLGPALLTWQLWGNYTAAISRSGEEAARAAAAIAAGDAAVNLGDFVEHFDARAAYPLHEAHSHLLVLADAAALEAAWPAGVRGASFAVHVSTSNLWRVAEGYALQAGLVRGSWLDAFAQATLPAACRAELPPAVDAADVRPRGRGRAPLPAAAAS
jgi:hypothetical protein